jgi:succinate dehydrogenase / fumarate reductase cytochrome b subunit
MSWLKKTFSSTIGRKFAMALSALFLLVFLLQHFAINITSVFSAGLFNELSHFMGANPLVQFLLQPVLIAGILLHFILGVYLEMTNKAARPIAYAQYRGSASATWMSRNMAYSGMAILLFMSLHFYDFWVPEIVYKYVEVNPEDPFRYYEELVHKFQNPVRIGLYVAAFVFLSLHLLHGFQSAFQSLGARHPKYYPLIEKLGKIYAIGIPAGFVFIALYHHFFHA